MFKTTCEQGHDIEMSDGFKYKNKLAARKYCILCKNDELKNIIENNDGYLINGKVIDFNSLITIKCNNNHNWETKFSTLRKGSWCPSCSSFRFEKICRMYFEQIFNAEFKKVRPLFLKQKNGHNLELDGFNNQLNIAFEHKVGVENVLLKKDGLKGN